MALRDEPVEILSSKYGLWDEFVKLYKEKRGQYLWPPQITALENGALNNKNFLMVSSAGSGKTHIAEIIIFKSIMDTTKPAVYLAPYNALVEQKTEDFKDLFESPELGLKVSKSTLEDVKDDLEKLKKSKLIVMTYEKFDYYLRNYPDFVSSLSCVIVDEFHMICEETRGPPLEIIVALLKEKFSNVKIVGLSAVIPNARDISSWLDANICDMGDWRKNPLYEGVFDLKKRCIEFYNHDKNLIKKEFIDSYCGNIVCNIIIDFIKKWGIIKDNNKPQILVFAPSRKNCVELAELISDNIGKIIRGSMISSNVLDEIGKKVESSEGNDTHLIKTLKKTVFSGVAFHHAGLSFQVKKILQKEFEDSNLLILISTTTLAAGMNLPTKRVIVTEPLIGKRKMLVSEYKNLAGRAGRPKFAEQGECVIISYEPMITESYKKNYIFALTEPLESKINLKEHLGIVLNLARSYPSVAEIVGILDKSLFGRVKNKQKKDLEIPIDLSISILEKYGFLTRNKSQLNLTILGESVSKQIINPHSVYIILQNLHKFKGRTPDRELFKDILLSICATPEFNDWERIWPNKRNIFSKREEIREKFGFVHLNKLDDLDKVINTVNIILDWMEEKSYQEIFVNNYIDRDYWGSSDIGERIAQIFARTIRTVREILKESDTTLFEVFDETLENLQYMTLFGIKKEHLPFVKMKIVRRRNTFKNLEKNGINSVDDLITKDIRELSKLIGKDLSINLKIRAIKAILQKESQEKELLKINAFKLGIELSLFERLFETTEKKFELAIEDSMKNLEPFLSVTPFHDQSVSKPEFECYLKDSKGKALSTIDGKRIKLCIECKSTNKLIKLVTTDSALEVLKKCPSSQYTHKIVIGTPGFEEIAKKSAEDHNILLIPISVYARMLLLEKQNKINELVLATIFNEVGELTTHKLKIIIEKSGKEQEKLGK